MLGTIYKSSHKKIISLNTIYIIPPRKVTDTTNAPASFAIGNASGIRAGLFLSIFNRFLTIMPVSCVLMPLRCVSCT